jgi:hypothetical protein
MNRKNKASIINIIDFMMEKTGITRQQADAAFKTIVVYMQQHPGEPLHKIISMMFGSSDKRSSELN